MNQQGTLYSSPVAVLKSGAFLTDEDAIKENWEAITHRCESAQYI
jgi:hypothetical protein